MNPKKVYSIDMGFVNRLGFGFSSNHGRLLENIVFIELIRRGKEVYYHAGKNECDFLVKEGLNVTEAIQVILHLDQINMQRELKGLKEAMAQYDIKNGLLITGDDDVIPPGDHQNINIVPIWKWLLTKYN